VDQAIIPLTIALPLGGAALLGGANRLLPRSVRSLIAIAIAMASTGLTLTLLADSAHGVLVYWFSGWRPVHGLVIGVDFAVDPLGAGLASLAGLLVSAALLYSWRFFDTVGALYHSLVLVFLAASVSFCLTGDLFSLFVAFELVAVTGFVLTGYSADRAASLQGGLNFAISNSLAGMVVLIGIALLYAHTGALNMAQIGQRLAGRPADGLVVVSFALLTGGFLVKAAVVPFHFWLPDAYGTAPIPACVLFSGVMSELGLFAVARVWETIFSGLHVEVSHLRTLLIAFGIATAVVGPIMALAQTHLKRMLAFLTMSHLGLYLIGSGLLTPLGLAGAALLVVGDGMAKAAMFFGVGALQHRRSSVDELKLKGRGAGLPVAGVVVVLGALVAADLPPFVASTGKDLLVEAADRLGQGWIELVVAFCVIVSSGAVLRAAGRIWLNVGPRVERSGVPAASDDRGDPGDRGDPRDPGDPGERGDPRDPGDPGSESARRDTERHRRRSPLIMLTPPVVLLALALALGLLPGVAERAAGAAASFASRSAYEAAVIRGRTLHAPHPIVPSPTITDLLTNLGEAAGALAIAALALWQTRWMDAARTTTVSAVKWLREIHTGHIGDQIAWLIAGLALLTGATGLALR
jgi:multicomponent Na+:H+ antiporter subunit D